jgi:hypothetical protein
MVEISYRCHRLSSSRLFGSTRASRSATETSRISLPSVGSFHLRFFGLEFKDTAPIVDSTSEAPLMRADRGGVAGKPTSRSPVGR